jgi:hypothetical protein
VHLDGLADLALVDRLGIDGEDGGVAHKDLHGRGAALGPMGIIWRADVHALVVLLHPGEQQRAVRHDDYVVYLVGLEEPLVLGPGDVLQGRIRLYVAVDDAGHTERQVLGRRVERHLRRVCAGFIYRRDKKLSLAVHLRRAGISIK